MGRRWVELSSPRKVTVSAKCTVFALSLGVGGTGALQYASQKVSRLLRRKGQRDTRLWGRCSESAVVFEIFMKNIFVKFFREIFHIFQKNSEKYEKFSFIVEIVNLVFLRSKNSVRIDFVTSVYLRLWKPKVGSHTSST